MKQQWVGINSSQIVIFPSFYLFYHHSLNIVAKFIFHKFLKSSWKMMVFLLPENTILRKERFELLLPGALGRSITTSRLQKRDNKRCPFLNSEFWLKGCCRRIYYQSTDKVKALQAWLLGYDNNVDFLERDMM